MTLNRAAWSAKALQCAMRLSELAAVKYITGRERVFVEAAKCLLEARGELMGQGQELELPDAGGWWWWWQTEYPPAAWEMRYVVEFPEYPGTSFSFRCSAEEDFNDETCVSGRWIKVTEPT